MKIVAFFNNKGGVGKTSLVHHLGWLFAETKRVLLADLDPQSNLTAVCLEEHVLETLWVDDAAKRKSIRGAVHPIIEGSGDIAPAYTAELSETLALVPGDLLLSEYEAKLSDAWPRCLDRDPAAFRVTSSLYRAIRAAAEEWNAELVFVDVGPNLGAINRAALIGCEHIITPLGADLFSLQALRNLGPTLRRWRDEWRDRLERNVLPPAIPMPSGDMEPSGYVVMQPNLYGGQVTYAYERWLTKIPAEYAASVLGEDKPKTQSVEKDPRCLAVLKHYRSLMPMAQTARKPIFHLTTADGAIGSHSKAVQDVRKQFRALAKRIVKSIHPVPLSA